MNIKDLKPAPYNPRMMAEKAKKGLRNSIKEFGDLSGIVFNKKTGNLVTGHHRLLSLKDEYGDKLEFITTNEDDQPNGIKTPNGDFFPIRIVHWEKPKEMAANITANNLSIQGRFTDELQPMLWKLKDQLKDNFNSLKMDSLVKHAKSRIIQAEQEFSEVINECNNYVVLIFKNQVDWLNAMTHFKLKTTKSQRANGKEWSKGIGRVINGSEYIKKATRKLMEGNND